MKYFIGEAAECVWVLRHGINRIIKKAFHHYNGAIGYFIGPFVNMIDKCSKNALGAKNFFYIVVRFGKEFAQPVFTADGTRKIEFMENGKFFFLVKDRYVAE